MSSLFDSGEPYEMHEDRTDRELTLGTGTILGIFFALALVCAVFFGFGYTMGRRSAQTTTAPVVADLNGAVSTNTAKPAAGSPLTRSASATRQADSADSAPAPSTTQPAETAAVQPTAKTATPAKAEAAPAPEPRPKAVEVAPAPLAHPELAAAAKPASVPTPTAVPLGTPGSSMVQIAAVSHQEDADVLVSALKRRGYAVAIRQEPQDKLLHVQIGPFATKKDADVMKQKLLADGYNAIVK